MSWPTREEEVALAELDAPTDGDEGIEECDRGIDGVAHDLNVRVDIWLQYLAHARQVGCRRRRVFADASVRGRVLHERIDALVQVHAHLAPAQDCALEAVAGAVGACDSR